MNRRDFLKTSAASGGSLLIGRAEAVAATDASAPSAALVTLPFPAPIHRTAPARPGAGGMDLVSVRRAAWRIPSCFSAGN